MSPQAQQIYADLMNRSANYSDEAFKSAGEQGFVPPYAGLRIAQFHKIFQGLMKT